MKNSRLLISAFLIAGLVVTQGANAYTVDNSTLTAPSGAPRFSDPDEQTPLQIFSPANGTAASQFQGEGAGGPGVVYDPFVTAPMNEGANSSDSGLLRRR